MIWFAYIAGTAFAAAFGICFALVLFFWIYDTALTAGRRLSFRLRQAFGMCRNKFRNTGE